jgi:hypothetical protein
MVTLTLQRPTSSASCSGRSTRVDCIPPYRRALRVLDANSSDG